MILLVVLLFVRLMKCLFLMLLVNNEVLICYVKIGISYKYNGYLVLLISKNDGNRIVL